MRELIAAGTIKGLNGRAATGLGLSRTRHRRRRAAAGCRAAPSRDEVLDIVVEDGCSFVIKPSTILEGVADLRMGRQRRGGPRGARRLGTRPKELLVQD